MLLWLPPLLLLLLALLEVPASSQAAASSPAAAEGGCGDDCGDAIAQAIVREASAAAAGAGAGGEAVAAAAAAAAVPSSDGRAASTQKPLSSRRESLAPVHVSVALARATRAVTSPPRLLSADDIALVLDVTRRVQRSTSDALLVGNAQNAKHALDHKQCTFLNRRPENFTAAAADLPANPFRALAPGILRTLLRFADHAWQAEGWSEPGNALEGIAAPGTPHGGVAGLKIRIVEHWRYTEGGHLADDFHYDGGSVLTIVAALNDDYKGGEFATLEPDGSQRLHPLRKGSAVCLVSHKYHSVRPVLRGERRSLVMELWQGGISGMGRG